MPQFVSLSSFLQIIVTALLTFVGFIAPDSVLNGRVEDRKKEILRTLSDTLDLLTISVEAGLSLNAAIAMVVRNVPGVLVIGVRADAPGDPARGAAVRRLPAPRRSGPTWMS